jgi:NAD(P)-dependent dehydrogenase (short-subunit alcohol dehydrogenase family)
LLQDRIAWVTGAGSGIGRATALALAEAGARVALTGRRIAPLEETAALMNGGGGQALVVAGDLTELAQIERAHREIVECWGDPDILVNNAGWNVSRRHWNELRPEDAAKVIGIILTAPFQLCLAVLPAMRRRGGGTLIHVASLAGVMIHTVSGPSYTATKHALIAMSDSLNAEEGIYGIRSIAICPGEVETPILDTRPEPPDAAARALMLQPEDVAAACLFCASLPPRACVTRLVMQPTDDNAFRDQARRIEARGSASVS